MAINNRERRPSMAISRSQLEKQIRGFYIGGILDSEMDDFAAGTDLQASDMEQPEEPDVRTMAPSLDSTYLNLLGQALRPVNYQAQEQKYADRLAGLYEPTQRPDFYQLMSDLGAGILSQKPDAGPYTGMAVGFKTFSDRMRTDREERRKQRQAIALEAAKLAMQDERAAEERLSSYAMEIIKNQSFGEVDILTLQYDEKDIDGNFTGRKITRGFDQKTDANEIRRIVSTQNGVPVADLPDPFEEGELSKIDARELGKESTEISKEEATSYATLDNLNQAEAIADQLGPDGFGSGQQLSLPARQFFGPMLPWLGIDLTKVSLQEALGTVTIGFTLANISQTKGAVSDSEMKLFIASAPFLGQTYEGFKRSIAIQRKAAAKKQEFAREYNRELARISAEAYKSGQRLTGTQARSAMNEWKSKWRSENRDSFLSPDDKKYLDRARKNAEKTGFTFDTSPFENRYRAYLQEQGEANQRAVRTTSSARDRIMASFEAGSITAAERDELLKKLEGVEG
jgi:hypothetical protein